METDNDQGLPAEPDDDFMGADGVGCPPARPVQFHRFGRHGRYDWSVRRRGQDDLPAGKRRFI